MALVQNVSRVAVQFPALDNMRQLAGVRNGIPVIAGTFAHAILSI